VDSVKEVRKAEISSARGRDLRLDFLRGLALLTIFINHNSALVPTGHRWLDDLTFGRFFFIDASDVFFFLSGLVSGMVYSRVFQKSGFAACQDKAFRRCFQLYLVEVGIAVVCLAIAHAGARAYLHPAFFDAPFLKNTLVEGLRDALALRNIAPHMSILPVYIVFIAMTPLMLLMRQRCPRILLIAFVSAYVAAQGHVRLEQAHGIDAWGFNPLAWQIVFGGGLLLGYERSVNRRDWRPGRLTIAAACAGLSIIMFLRVAPGKVAAGLLNSDVLANLIPRTLPFTDKHNAEPLRLVNLALWVIVFASIKPAAAFLHSRFAAAIVKCGQCSLPVFVLGIVLNYMGVAWMGSTAENVAEKLAFTFAGCGLLLSTGYLWPKLKTVGIPRPVVSRAAPDV
jgi:hypothetical protein